MGNDDLGSVRRLRDKIRTTRKETELEVRQGDMIVNRVGETMIVVRTHTKYQTMKESVEYVLQSRTSEGIKSMTLNRLRKQVSKGAYQVYKGAGWSDVG